MLKYDYETRISSNELVELLLKWYNHSNYIISSTRLSISNCFECI